MSASSLFYTSLLAAAALLVTAQTPPRTSLRILEAGVNGRRGTVLRNGITFCPDSFRKNGFTVVCDAPNSRTAFFYVNGVEKRLEVAYPFTIAGDFAGKVYRWDAPTGAVSIRCRPDSNEQVTVHINIKCNRPFGRQQLNPAPSDTPIPNHQQRLVIASSDSPIVPSYVPIESLMSQGFIPAASDSPLPLPRRRAFRAQTKQQEFLRAPSDTPSPLPTLSYVSASWSIGQRIRTAPSDSPSPTSTVVSPMNEGLIADGQRIIPIHSVLQPTRTPKPTQAAGSSTLRVVFAGANGASRTIMELRDGFTLCPRNFPRGISVVCDSPDAVRASFFINGELIRREFVAPFMIAGNSQSNAFAWRSFPIGRVTIRCSTASKASSMRSVAVVTGTICT